MPPTLKPTGAQADAATARIQTLSDEQLVDDEQLRTLLDPFRGHRPLRMRCPRRQCGRTINWCAVHLVLGLTVFYDLGPRKGYVEKIDKNSPPSWRQEQPPAPYNYWSLGPAGGNDSARPASQSVYHDRWTFTCPKCASEYTLTNRTLLTKIITALTGNKREFTP